MAILAVIAVVQIADPGVDGPDRPPVVENPSTESLLSNAMERTATTSHTEVVVVSRRSNVTNISQSYYRQVKYAPQQRRYLETMPNEGGLASEPTAFGYASDSMGWVRRGRGNAWREASHLRYGSRPIVRPSHLQTASVTVVTENESQVVIEAHVESADKFINYAPLTSGNCCHNLTITFNVNKEEQTISSLSSGNIDSGKIDITFSRYGNTSISRPSDLPTVSTRGLLWDLKHGPITPT